MGATSTQGVGNGAAVHKGPKNERGTFTPTLTPHVVMAGRATTSGGGTVTVYFPESLPYTKDRYVVMVTALTGTTSHSVAKTNDSNGLFSYFVITGANSTVHEYAVITTGTPFVG